MLKTFMIEKVVEEKITDSVGRMTFHLVDENGDCRTVSGTTYLDENQRTQGISSESTRELPLIEHLFSSRDKKIVDIEFEHFNKIYDRGLDKTINQLAYEKVLQMQKEKTLTYRIANFFKKSNPDNSAPESNRPEYNLKTPS